MLREPGTFDGLTLLSPLNSKSIHLVDLDGKVVHTWETQHIPGGGTYLLDNGHVLRCAQKDDNPRFHGGGIGGLIEEFDWDGKVVWEYELATTELTQHHDLYRFKNGNIALIAWEYHSPDEARAHGRVEEFIDKEGLWTDVVMEIKPSHPKGGEVVWQWRTWDHLVQDHDPKLADYGDLKANAGRIDINADHRYMPKETPEEKKKREETARQMKALGYTGGNDPDDPDSGKKAHADSKSNKNGGADSLDKPDKLDKHDPLDKADKLDKPETLDKKDKLDKADKLDKLDAPDKLGQADHRPPADGHMPPPDGHGPPPDGKKPGPKIDSDWLHMNGIDYNADLDLLLVSTPHLCELWVIDHSTTTAEAATKSGGKWGKGGELLYRWGNPQDYGIGSNTDRKLFYQHNPTWLTDAPKGEARVLVYNNGSGRKPKEYSEVDELVLPFDAKRGFAREPDRAFGPSEPAWSYSDPENFFSGFISGAQRLPNGNTLICMGAPGRVFEVTRDKKIVWDYWNPLGGEIAPTKQGGKAPPHALFRATRVPPKTTLQMSAGNAR
jgi:hypothetical protein